MHISHRHLQPNLAQVRAGWRGGTESLAQHFGRRSSSEGEVVGGGHAVFFHGGQYSFGSYGEKNNGKKNSSNFEYPKPPPRRPALLIGAPRYSLPRSFVSHRKFYNIKTVAPTHSLSAADDDDDAPFSKTCLFFTLCVANPPLKARLGQLCRTSARRPSCGASKATTLTPTWTRLAQSSASRGRGLSSFSAHSKNVARDAATAADIAAWLDPSARR